MHAITGYPDYAHGTLEQIEIKFGVSLLAVTMEVDIKTCGVCVKILSFLTTKIRSYYL